MEAKMATAADYIDFHIRKGRNLSNRLKCHEVQLQRLIN